MSLKYGERDSKTLTHYEHQSMKPDIQMAQNQLNLKPCNYGHNIEFLKHNFRGNSLWYTLKGPYIITLKLK